MEAAAAASLGPLAQIDGFHGSVLAASPGAVVLAPSGPGHLLVVHDVAHGHTPTSVQVQRSHLAGVRAGDRADGRAGHLLVGPLVVDTRAAHRWVPAEARRTGAMTPGWWAGLPDPAPVLAGGIRAVIAEASRGDAAHRLRALVGLGPGSTPAGDDALVGLLATLHRCAPASIADPLLAVLARDLTPLLARTTPVSAHHLRLALDGHLSEHLVDVVDDLAALGAVQPHHLARQLATGATSGRDALAGVVTALHQLLPCPQPLEDVA